MPLLATLLRPFPWLTSAWQHRDLIRSLAWRDVMGRYQGSSFGLLWSLLQPLLMLAVYTLVFGAVFKSQWPNTPPGFASFATVLFSGMIVYNLFVENFQRAPTMVLTQPNLVKKVVFPLDILPWVHLLASLVHASISFAVWMVFAAASIGLHGVIWQLPLALLPLGLALLGVSWLLGALGVYVRDISQTVGLVAMVLMFLSPICYPETNIPAAYRDWFNYSPLNGVVHEVRQVLIWHHGLDWDRWAVQMLVALAMAMIGHACFQRLRPGFADVI